MTTEKEDQPRAARRADDEARVLFLQVPLPRRVATPRCHACISHYPKGLLMVTANADVTALSVTGQIPGSHHGWNPPPAWRARPARCTNGRANTPRQFGHAEECENEWSMDWVTRRNTRHVGGRGGVLCTSKSVSWCPFHQGRSGAALGCKRDKIVNFLRIYGILGEPGAEEGGGHAHLRIKLPPVVFMRFCGASRLWARAPHC
jgi:hypothetical protein